MSASIIEVDPKVGQRESPVEDPHPFPFTLLSLKFKFDAEFFKDLYFFTVNHTF